MLRVGFELWRRGATAEDGTPGGQGSFFLFCPSDRGDEPFPKPGGRLRRDQSLRMAEGQGRRRAGQGEVHLFLSPGFHPADLLLCFSRPREITPFPEHRDLLSSVKFSELSGLELLPSAPRDLC